MARLPGIVLVLAVALVAAGCGVRNSKPFNAGSTAGCLKSHAFTGVTTNPAAVGFIAAFADRPEVQAFQTYLSSDTWANNKAKATPLGGWVSANKGLDINNLVSPIDQLSAQILQDPDAVFRFDGSDQMPGEVGSGSFWREMTSWVAGQEDAKTALNNIEASWPQ